jgi:hypothetical protein
VKQISEATDAPEAFVAKFFNHFLKKEFLFLIKVNKVVLQ